MLLDMVADGAAVDVWDAATIRAHHMRLVKMTDQAAITKAQQEFNVERRKRLAERA